ncbi:hypothetical protein LCGC14_1116890 [marine sediment metagenome]|uniref:Uncharacterized protein n=1 Tax=marine sediment metagenome TaxID=412755 RepID=A0A0F9MT02_9ZZZZ
MTVDEFEEKVRQDCDALGVELEILQAGLDKSVTPRSTVDASNEDIINFLYDGLADGYDHLVTITG